MDIEIVKKELAGRAVDGRITCAECFAVAEKLNVPKDDFAKILNDMDIRIIKCQLGCF